MILLAGLETALNALLTRDPAAPARLAALAGKRLVVSLSAPRLCLLVQFHEQGLHLQHINDKSSEECDKRDADASVELDGKSLGALLGGTPIERLMLSGQLAVRGNPGLLEAARDLLLDLDTDAEGGLARLIGDMPAYQLAESARRLGRFGKRSAGQLHADASEYLLEEARLLTGYAQQEVARDLLTEIGIASDRLDARIRRIENVLLKNIQTPVTGDLA